MDLTAAHWRLTVEFGKLIFSAWNSGRSFSRRVEEVAYRDRDRFGIFVRKPGGRETTTLEFRELRAPAGVGRAAGRTGFRQQLIALLEREYRGWKFERVSNRSDREHSFSAWYTRGMARQGRSAWAFLGLSEEEGTAAADGVLAFGLIWLDWLRSQADGVAITHLKLFLPPAAVSVIAHRAAYLDPRALSVEIYEWRAGQPSATRVDLKDYGNVETRLAVATPGRVAEGEPRQPAPRHVGRPGRGNRYRSRLRRELSPRCASRVWKWLASRANWRRASISASRAAFAGWTNRAAMSSGIFSARFEGFGARAAPTLSTNFTGFNPSAGSKACSSRTLPGLIRRFRPSMCIRRFRHSRGPIEGSLTFSPRRAGDGWRWWNSRSRRKSTSPSRGWIIGCA